MGATRFGPSLAARLLVGVPFLGLTFVCVGLALGSDKLTLDRLQNIVTYRANGGYFLHSFALDRLSPPEVRDRTYSTRLSEVTSHFLYFDHLEETTFVFDGHPAEDLQKAAATVKAFLEANKVRSTSDAQ